METSITDLIKKVSEHPLKRLEGQFRTSLNFQDWDFENLDKFLNEEKPYVILNIDGDFLKLEINSDSIFDGDLPTEPKDLYFLNLDEDKKLLLMLHTDENWPHFSETGEFVALMNLV